MIALKALFSSGGVHIPFVCISLAKANHMNKVSVNGCNELSSQGMGLIGRDNE